MTEFYEFSLEIRLLITFIFGICIFTQTLALVLSFYRHSLTIEKVFELFLEILILVEILMFSLLYGQVLSGYKNGFVIPIGYENKRVFLFFLILIFIVILCILKRKLFPLHILPATLISLPIVENQIGEVFSWLFLMALIFFLIRSIRMCVFSVIAIKTNISSLSVINAIDTLHTGVLFSENDGTVLLCNHQMQKIMIAITGKVFRNSIQFYDMLISNKQELKYKKAELDGQMVYLFPDGSAWMFTKTDILFRMKRYIHISVADVSKLWELTVKLQTQDKELRYKRDELKKRITSLQMRNKEKELENAKMRAHDILGQRLSVILRMIQNDHKMDYDLLMSLSKGLLEKLKEEQSEIKPYDELESIQQIFATIGVEIKLDGKLPQNEQQAYLFVDIIREASTNAVRHGFATNIDIKVESIENLYNIRIVNNGHTTTAPIIQGSGIGVMRKKILASGGSLDIIFQPFFTLVVILPGGEKDE